MQNLQNRLDNNKCHLCDRFCKFCCYSHGSMGLNIKGIKGKQQFVDIKSSAEHLVLNRGTVLTVL